MCHSCPNEEEEDKRKEKDSKAGFDHHLLRINLTWMGGANRCTPPSDSSELQGKGKNRQLFEISIKTFTAPSLANTFGKTTCPLFGPCVEG
jgi:hypothetical protein